MYPQQRWMQFMTPEEAGFSSERLQRAEAYFHKTNAAAMFIICHGGVITSWGEVSRRFRCHSIRKSFLSALYGIYAAEGRINLQATLADLDIDDEKPLTEEEKQARVIDLLKSQSGIYLPAAYEEPQQREARPLRGIHAPGTHYWYNNWDFNTLCTIFENEVGIGVFEAFKERIANPLQMEEFRLIDTNYFWERQYSQHPAYLFRLSAKDLARFGLLYLRNGRWNGQQIIPPQWITQSTTPYSGGKRCEFGLCWNVYGPESWNGRLHNLRTYISLGAGGHYVAVMPEVDLVIVSRVNTFEGDETPSEQIIRMWDLILDAQESQPLPDPNCILLSPPPPKDGTYTLAPSILRQYVGRYVSYDGEFEGRVFFVEDWLALECTSPMQWTEYLMPQSQTSFILEDSQMPVYFNRNDLSELTQIELRWRWKDHEAVFYGKNVER